MLSRTHVLFGTSILFLVSSFFNIEITLSLFLICIFASLLPDIDQRSSKIGKKFKFVSLIFDHRGLLHTIWFAILFSIMIHETIGRTESIVFFAVYISHLLLDALTKKGVYPFYPLKIRMNGNIKVGKIKEIIFFYILLFGGIIIFVYTNFLSFFH